MIQERNIQVGLRCCVNGNNENRGEVAWVGSDKALGKGMFVGVKLDEPMGNCTGSVKGKVLFKCDKNYGVFLKPERVETGDFEVIDVFGDDDEI
mmetsp:Transcript_90857/g.196598  ORF Transcript_90857/g.196598 Transcript_90857/m.196598 type:complete len:94 (-) Transcript_90857:40-321(-)